jgi:hypothetical protein
MTCLKVSLLSGEDRVLVKKIERRLGDDLGLEDIKMDIQDIGWQREYLLN